MKKILLVFAVILFALPAFAAQWQQIDAKVYLDVNSIRHSSNQNIVFVWTKYLNDGKWTNNKKINYMMEYDVIDCANKTSGIVSQIAYSINGSVLETRSAPTPIYYHYEPIIPNSVGEAMYNYVCGNTNQ